MNYERPPDMTEQEARELAALALRLKRVWAPEKVTFCAFGQRGLLNWAAQIQGNTYVAINVYRDGSEFHCFCKDGVSLYVDHDGQVEVREEDASRGNQFATDWMPFFRRGCWLSGVPIEATAHEKAEWMQGFSQQEVKAWNLKI